MIVAISHKERGRDQRLHLPHEKKTKMDFYILEKAKEFLENKFGFKYLGVIIKDGRTISYIEAPNLNIVKKCVEIGTPIFSQLTETYEDIQVKEVAGFDCQDKLEQAIEKINLYKEVA